ncbi:Ig-like domain-containing protein [Vibrio campbellii]|uniref:Ig-like domain-containing protein n=1 Tax=Vibrio campbellii TaxID=680 RepID=UPI000CD37417|nr:Ig-like domain-containing protein [Vibrio campbellii]AUW07483.1 hypothetical protein C1N51_28070 [Vibrio campbellii]
MINVKNIFVLSLVASAVALVGCGGENSSENSLPPPGDPTPLLAMDGFSITKPDEKTFIDLSGLVRGNNVKIVSVEPSSGNLFCGEPKVNGLGVDVLIEDGMYCQYEYTAVQEDASIAHAALNVLATAAEEPMLPPISKPLMVGSGTTTFNLPELLGSDWKISYTLNIDSVQVQGMEGNLGSVSAEGNVISYTPPELSGWNRVLFTLNDTGAESVMGTIFVTVSDEVNRPPSISVPKYEYRFSPENYDRSVSPFDIGCNGGGKCSTSSGFASNAMGSSRNLLITTRDSNWMGSVYLPIGNEHIGKTVSVLQRAGWGTSFHNGDSSVELGSVGGVGKTKTAKNVDGNWYLENAHDIIYVGDKVTIDLSSLSGLSITDPDGDEWQLIEVQSFSASVFATNPEIVTNKSFDFTAPTAGNHYVSYIVADHNNGYTSGLIKINVTAKGGPATWNDITTSSNTYLKPLTYNDAISQGFLVSQLWDETANNTVAGFNSISAQNYCSSVGWMPSVSEMDLLRKGPTAELAKWPKANPYLASQGFEYKLYDLSTGNVRDYESQQVYLTCKQDTSLTLNVTNYTIIANGDVTDLGVINSRIDKSVQIDKVSGSLSDDQVNLVMGSKVNGSIPLTTSSTTAGTYRFKVSFVGEDEFGVASGVVEYIGDVSSANGTFPVDLRGLPNGLTTTRVEVTVLDANGNKIIGKLISLASNFNTDEISSPQQTNSEGKAFFDLKFKSTGERTLSIVLDERIIGQGYIEPEARWWSSSGHSSTQWNYKFLIMPDEFIGSEPKPFWFDSIKLKAQHRFIYEYPFPVIGATHIGDYKVKWVDTLAYYEYPWKQADLDDCYSRGGRKILHWTWGGPGGETVCVGGWKEGPNLPTTWSASFYNLTQRFETREGYARVVRDAPLGDFLNQCSLRGSSGVTITHDSGEFIANVPFELIGCGYLSFTGEGWSSRDAIRVSGGAMNNLGIELPWIRR